MVFTDQQYEVDPKSGDVTVEWAGTGPTADFRVSEFMCRLPDGTSTNCELTTTHRDCMVYRIAGNFAGVYFRVSMPG